MPPRIKFDDGFVLTADNRAWMIGTIRTRTSGKHEGDEYLADTTYYTSLRTALRALVERRLRDSEATTLSDLLIQTERLRKEVNQAVPDE